jgi:hypothetical protein
MRACALLGVSLLRSNLQYFCTILIRDYPIERYRSGSNGAQTQSLSEFKYIHGLPVPQLLRCIHRILNALTTEKVYRSYVKLPTHTSPVPQCIRDSKYFYLYFKDCIGAINGTHIPAYVPAAIHMQYRDQKNQVSQNVLAACSMDMEFLYMLPGWEGSAADSRVFEDAQDSDFIIPEGHYYLADAGYPNLDLLLVPYHGVRYHLKEWATGGNK